VYKTEVVRALEECLAEVNPSLLSQEGAVWAVFKPLIPSLLSWLDEDGSSGKREALAKCAAKVAAAWERDHARSV
jgi:hypothetical protein